MVIEMTNGMIDQTVSSTIEPCISSGVAYFSFSRYLIPKKKIAATIGIVNATLTRIRYAYRASTCHAKVEACSGNNGTHEFVCINSIQRSAFSPQDSILIANR